MQALRGSLPAHSTRAQQSCHHQHPLLCSCSGTRPSWLTQHQEVARANSGDASSCRARYWWRGNLTQTPDAALPRVVCLLYRTVAVLSVHMPGLLRGVRQVMQILRWLPRAPCLPWSEPVRVALTWSRVIACALPRRSCQLGMVLARPSWSFWGRSSTVARMLCKYIVTAVCVTIQGGCCARILWQQ